MRHNFYRLTMVLLCVAGILFTGGKAEAQAITIVVAPESIVSGPYITLGDIADIRGSDADRITALRQIKLGPAPSPGRSFVFSTELLRVRVSAAKVDCRGIVWQVPPQFKVTASSQVLRGQMITAEAEQYLKTRLSGADVVITPITQVEDLFIPPGTVTYDFELPYGVKYNSPTTVSIGVQVAGQTYKVVHLKFDIRKYEQVAVTTRALAARELIAEEHVSFERRDVGRLPPGYFTDINKILGLAVKRQLAPGTVITDSMLEKPILIQRGKTITIVARIGGIEVSAPGIALQNGSENQVIKVKNANSNKTITGRVINETTVQAHLSRD